MFELARQRSNRAWPRPGSLGKRSACLSSLMALILSGCVQYSVEGAKIGRTKPVTHYLPGTTSDMSHGLRQCSNADQQVNPNKAKPASYPSLMTQPGRHAPGDVIRLDLTDGEGFGGVYELNPDGTVILPYVGPVRAAGLTTLSLAGVIRKTLVSKGYFRENQIDVSVVPLRWAPAQISVTGAVFQPGSAVINPPKGTSDPEDTATTGDMAFGRYLDTGIRAASGVRPDADLTKVTINRGNQSYTIDLSGVITGRPVPSIPLQHGDTIHVPSRACYSTAIIRPSQLTPPGIRVFMSNLISPAYGNSAGAVGKYATNVPYGTRLLEGAISANCVGGTHLTNAPRSVVLFSRNPLTGATDRYERSLKELARHADDPRVNPYLMPNDAVACFDSGVTNARDVGRALTEILGPLSLGLAFL